MTIARALNLGQQLLKPLNTPAELEAEVLLTHVLNTSRAHLLAHPEQPISFTQSVHYAKALWRRRYGRPIAYLTGSKDFYGLTFYVNQHVLIPRPDTETLIDATRKHLDQKNISTVIDIGTGSGCIAVTLAHLYPALKIFATDISLAALEVARKNAQLHNVVDRITFCLGNLLDPVKHFPDALGSRTLVVSNPPYLQPHEYTKELKPEPRGALIGGADGLQIYQKLFAQLTNLETQKRPMALIVEVHPPTVAELTSHAQTTFPHAHLTIISDLSGRPRVMQLVFN